MLMTRKFGIVILLFLLLALLASIQPALAQDTAPKPTPSDNEVNRVAKQMYCPVCENTPLDVCPTQACSEWRELIRLKLSEGWNDQQIKDYFAAQYGDRVLSEPPRRGLNWLVYTLPVIFFLAGVLVLYQVLLGKRGHKPAAAAPTPPPAADEDPYLREMEEELKKSK
jgi:cytochrome c-type biogenesis protein CcmH